MKRYISILAVICMILTMVPAASFAAESVSAIDDATAAAGQTPAFAEPAETEPTTVTTPAGWTANGQNWLYYQNGTALLGFQSFGASTYFFDAMGLLQWGFRSINGAKYYFDETALTPGTTPGDPGQRLGVMHTGWLRDHDDGTGKIATYYFQANGQAKAGGFLREGKYRYFFKKSGRMKTGWLKRNGKKFYLRPDGTYKGAALTGLHAIDGDRYFFNDNGVMKKGVIQYNEELYYFDPDGKAQKSKGWFTGADKKKRYCYGKGRIASGTVKIGSTWYVFDTASGAYLKTLGDDTDRAVQKYSSKTDKLLYVKRADHYVRVYTGSKGNWKHYSTMTCSVGTKSTPTPKGSFTIVSKDEVQVNSKQTVNWWYNTHFYGSLQFQSILYYTDAETKKPAHVKVYDGRLGQNISDGCIRLSLANAEWIYKNVTEGTKVIIK